MAARAQGRHGESFAAYRSAESRLLLRLCLACAYFVALRGPRWLAQSQRDYASALLGVPHSSFLRWVRVGRLLAAQPKLRAPFRKGQLSLRTLDDRARHGEFAHGGRGAHSAYEQDRLGTNSEPRTTAGEENSKPRRAAAVQESNRDSAGEST
ncbi:MAG TPA: hypothetical protein VKA63_07625, partial [Candidatus Krumholzibacteria bacterium]|nr:hypothetical protein [Candidatus Krumholzibacteria bacterium]